MLKPIALLVIMGTAAIVQAAPPNVVFILADDLGWSDLGCYGNAVHDTPHIDQLAAAGMRFTQAYAPAPICSASRAAFLTGKSPARLRFEFVTKSEPGEQQLPVPLQSPPYTLDLPLEEVTLGEMLAAAGYITGFFGKWHVSRHHQGYLGWSPTHGPIKQGFSEGDGSFGSHPYAYRGAPKLKAQTLPEGEYPHDDLIDQAIQFIERHRNERFFLYLSSYYVHDPVHSRCPWLIRKYRDRLPRGAPPVRAEYAAMVETLDHLVGRILAAIDRAGLTRTTLVVFTSDNGGHPNYMSNAPLRGSKWNLYEGGVRVPLIVRWPGHVQAGARCDAVAYGCDLFPTLTETAGGNAPEDERDGVSLWPVLRDGAAPLYRPQPVVWHFPYYHPESRFEQAPREIGVGDFVTSQTRPHSAIRDGEWKLLYFYEEERCELYNLASDLGEQENVAHEHPQIAARLRQQLQRQLSNVNARLPVRAR